MAKPRRLQFYRELFHKRVCVGNAKFERDKRGIYFWHFVAC